jgi:hypothetical protein
VPPGNTEFPGFRFLSLFRTRHHFRRKEYIDVKAFLRHESFVKELIVLPSADSPCFRKSFRLPETSRHTVRSKFFPEAALEIVAYSTLQRKCMNMLICSGRCSAIPLAILVSSPDANYVKNRSSSLSLYIEPLWVPKITNYQPWHSLFDVYAHQR